MKDRPLRIAGTRCHRNSAGRVAAAIAVLGAVSTVAQPPGHGVHPLMPDQRLIVRCRMLNATPPSTVETILAVDSPSEVGKPQQMLHLPAPAPPIRFVHYLPHAVLEQKVVASADDRGLPAAELAIEGPSQSFRRWLIAGDEERNRLTSYIGTWRYMTVADAKERDELLSHFETEFTREPKVVVSRPDGGGARELPLSIDETQTIDDLKCKVRVRQFMPHYAVDRARKTPMNQSNRRANPAALVEIEVEGRTESRWVFAKFPEFDQRRDEALPVQIALNCPAQGEGESPDFALVTIGEKNHEVWIRTGGATTVRRVETNDSVDIPGSPYHFRITDYLSSGTMIENYRSDDHGKAPPSLEVEYTNEKNAPTRLWLALGHHRRIATPVGAMMVSLNVRGDAPQLGHP